MSAILVGKAKKARTGGDAVAKLLLIVMADYANVFPASAGMIRMYIDERR